MFRRSLVAVISPLALAAVCSVLVSAQDDAQTDDNPQPAQTAQSEQELQTTIDLRAVQQAGRRTLYFIGPKARAERQLGPGIGAPKSILPTPFVPRGSLTVPAALGAEQSSGGLLENTTEQEGVDVGSAELVAVDQVNTPLTNQEQPQDQQEPGTAELNDPFGELFQEGALERLDPSGIPVNAGIGAGDIETVWRGYSRAEITQFLNRIEKPTLSPALSRLASAVAASRLILPEPAQDNDIIDMLAARLAVFEANADVAAYTALIDALPIDRDWSALAQHQAHAHLLKGELPDACVISENQRAVDISAYWVRLSAFCMAAEGNRVGVDFQLGILEETRSLDTTFYQLLDQILIEAEQPAGAVIPQPIILSAPMPADIVSAAMARLARVEINDIDLNGANLLAVQMLLQNPSLSAAAQVKLFDVLLARGVADPALMSSAAISFPIDSVLLSSLLAADVDAQEPEGDTESVPDQIAKDGENTLADAQLNEAPSDTLKQMTLLAAVAQQTDDAQRALERLWEYNAENGTLARMAATLHVLTETWPREKATADALSIAVRAAALTNNEAFDQSILALRTQAVGADAAKDDALVRLWPLMAIADTSSTSADQGIYDAALFERWWFAMADDENKFAVANSLLTAMDGFGFDVLDSSWALISSGPAVFEGGSVSPSLWRVLQSSAEAEDPVATLGALYALYSETNAKDIPPSVVGALISSLRKVGFDATARTIAFDVLISQGL